MTEMEALIDSDPMDNLSDLAPDKIMEVAINSVRKQLPKYYQRLIIETYFLDDPYQGGRYILGHALSQEKPLATPREERYFFGLRKRIVTHEPRKDLVYGNVDDLSLHVTANDRIVLDACEEVAKRLPKVKVVPDFM